MKSSKQKNIEKRIISLKRKLHKLLVKDGKDLDDAYDYIDRLW